MRHPFARKPAAQHEGGFTLTELAIVLGIIGIILGAIWSAAAKVYANRKVTTAVHQILNDANSVKALYPTGNIQGGGQNLSPLLINSGAVSSDVVTSCTGLTWGSGYGGSSGCEVNPWNEQVIIGTQGGWFGFTISSSRFEIGMNPMTNQQCTAFLAALVPQAAQGGLVNVYSDATGITAVTTSTTPTAFSNCSGSVALQFQL